MLLMSCVQYVLWYAAVGVGNKNETSASGISWQGRRMDGMAGPLAYHYWLISA